MTFYSYVFKSDGVVLGNKEFGRGTSAGKKGWDGLKNSVVFTWGFLEMVLWFWVSGSFALSIPVLLSLQWDWWDPKQDF